MKIADKILSLRKRDGLSQELLAEGLEVSRQAVSKWESGQSIPEPDKLLALARTFGVTTDYLLDDTLESPGDAVTGSGPGPAECAESRARVAAWWAMGFLAIGLVVAALGWWQWQTPVPVAVGFIMQLCGCIFREVSGAADLDATQNRRARARFYRLGVWLLLPVPVVVGMYAMLAVWPRPVPMLLAQGIALTVYLAAALVVTLVLRKAAK